jgi:hypothetical protein
MFTSRGFAVDASFGMRSKRRYCPFPRRHAHPTRPEVVVGPALDGRQRRYRLELSSRNQFRRRVNDVGARLLGLAYRHGCRARRILFRIWIGRWQFRIRHFFIIRVAHYQIRGSGALAGRWFPSSLKRSSDCADQVFQFGLRPEREFRSVMQNFVHTSVASNSGRHVRW